MQWLVVPRHPQRFDEVAALAAQAGLSVSRRSSWTDAAGAAAPPTSGSAIRWARCRCTTALSDVALLGGSFLPLGGQNLIEAAACGCPVVMGPHTFNFAEAADNAQAAGAAVRVATLEERHRRRRRHRSPIRSGAATHSQAGLRFARAHRGAAAKTAVALLELLRAGG